MQPATMRQEAATAATTTKNEVNACRKGNGTGPGSDKDESWSWASWRDEDTSLSAARGRDWVCWGRLEAAPLVPDRYVGLLNEQWRQDGGSVASCRCPRCPSYDRGMSFGVLIPGLFGLVWIGFAGDGLASGWVVACAAVAIVMLVAAGLRRRRAPMPSSGNLVGRGYWGAVVFEVVAAVAGFVVIGAAGLPPSSSRGWVEIVVGPHFLLLSRAWMRRWTTQLSALGLLLVLAGGIAMGAAIAGAPTGVVSVFGGLIPGLLLSGWCLLTTFRSAAVTRRT